MSDPGIALDVRLAKDGDARRYRLQQCAKLPGWVVSVDRGGRTMPQLGCVWDPDRALELWADLAAEIATLRAEGWVDTPATCVGPARAQRTAFVCALGMGIHPGGSVMGAG